MQYPLIDRQLLVSLRLAHGTYNFLVMLLFWHQAWLGIKIRKARKARAPLPFPAIRQHRKGGPLYAVLAVLGYVYGIILVMLDTGKIFEYPPHLFLGTVLVLLMIASVAISRTIRGQESASRTPHFAIGIAILSVYPVQVFLGLGALF
ncbi:MAG TPA: DUF4079 family protein [Nitrospirota bacterium]|nr:DUF4079 family protein [Nitrospirota bacterium]